MVSCDFVLRRFSLAAALCALFACGPSRDPNLDELSQSTLATTPPEARTAIQADLDSLAALSREEKLGKAEHDALVDLFRSVTRDGQLDDDERLLLVRLVRDVVAGGGSVAHEKQT